ncbi:MAG: BlaI/MecI/CopY family transcriptional regulator [Candidatus Sericytochromatia bacterium]|nr:BlaI/MecI/CopY family transcriptional regulator [Candidatus Sericytochromatia bacterium]
MEVLWRETSATVRDVCQSIAERNLAYTTIMTTLDRLHKKGLLAREKQGHAFVYRAIVDRQTHERRLVASVLAGIPSASREALLSGFLDYAGDDDHTLHDLERLIAARKQAEG